MDILDKMEAALRSVRGMCNCQPTGEGFFTCKVCETLREYESLKGQIAVVPVQTSEAREAALDDFREQLEIGSIFLSDTAINIIEAALQQPDTSEAVRVLVDALQAIAKSPSVCAVIAKNTLNDPAVIAAMKGEDQ